MARHTGLDATIAYRRSLPVVELDAVKRNVRKDSVVEDNKPLDRAEQLGVFSTLSRCLPDDDEHCQFWWKVTGKHVAITAYEAGFSAQRQTELLLFFRFTVIPRLGPKPTSRSPAFRSGVAGGPGDGSPLAYHWSFGTGAHCRPYLQLEVEPMGRLSGTLADPLNDSASREMALAVANAYPQTDLSVVWKYAAHLRPQLTDLAASAPVGSAMQLTLGWSSDSLEDIDVKAGLSATAPSQIPDLLSEVLPVAVKDSYGADASLQALDLVRAFIERHPHGRHLTVLSSTAVDCKSPVDAKFSISATTDNLSFDHIATVLTLGGRRRASSTSIEQLRQLWYSIKGVPSDTPTSAQCPALNSCVSNSSNASGVAFLFEIHPDNATPKVSFEIDVRKHSDTDMAAIDAVSSFLRYRGQGRDAAAYLNVLKGMMPSKDLETCKGLQATFTFAIEGDDIEIKSCFLPQAYRRFNEIQFDLMFVPERSRKSAFE